MKATSQWLKSPLLLSNFHQILGFTCLLACLCILAICKCVPRLQNSYLSPPDWLLSILPNSCLSCPLTKIFWAANKRAEVHELREYGWMEKANRWEEQGFGCKWGRGLGRRGGLGSIKDITLCNKLIRVVYVLGPEWSELWKCNVKPWLSLPIIVDDSSLFCGC